MPTPVAGQRASSPENAAPDSGSQAVPLAGRVGLQCKNADPHRIDVYKRQAIWSHLAEKFEIETAPGDHLGMLTTEFDKLGLALTRYLDDASSGTHLKPGPTKNVS